MNFLSPKKAAPKRQLAKFATIHRNVDKKVIINNIITSRNLDNLENPTPTIKIADFSYEIDFSIVYTKGLANGASNAAGDHRI